MARREDGFTLIELLVAITVTAIGLLALVSSFDHSRDLVGVSEKVEVASHRAERELERILAKAYTNVGHATTPPSSTDPTKPASYVTGASYQWDQGTTGPQSETLVVEGTGEVSPVPDPWTDSESRLSGTVQSFVTWTGGFCTTADRSDCAKRVTVAVTVDGPRPLRKPVLISTVMTDPGNGS
jgi:prepilin-type N-terminal cleavage/methylation domain-containing protein